MADESDKVWEKYEHLIKRRNRKRVQGQPLCYCDSKPQTILRDLIEGSIPDEALLRVCCWKEICTVRGSNVDAIDYEQWRGLCRRRGRLVAR